MKYMLMPALLLCMIACNKKDVIERTSTEKTQALTESADHNVDLESAIQPFLPEEHKLSDFITGDLNNDSKDDIVFISQGPASEDIAGSRYLGVLLHKDGGYIFSSGSHDVIMHEEDGGIMGDPFLGISIINKNVLLVEHYGGSAWRWGHAYKFKYKSDNIYLIGTTSSYFNVAGYKEASHSDFNLATGNCIFKETDEDGNESRTQKNCGRKKVKLEDFGEYQNQSGEKSDG